MDQDGMTDLDRAERMYFELSTKHRKLQEAVKRLSEDFKERCQRDIGWALDVGGGYYERLDGKASAFAQAAQELEQLLKEA